MHISSYKSCMETIFENIKLCLFSAWCKVTEELKRQTQKNVDVKQVQRKWSDMKSKIIILLF